MEQAREGVAGGVQFARLLVTSAEFRDELVEGMGVIQQSLRRSSGRPGGQRADEGLVSEGETTKEAAAEGYAEDEEDEKDEEGWFEEGQGQQREEEGTAGWTGGLMGKGYQPRSQDQIDRVAQRFVNLLKRVQAKPEYQERWVELLSSVACGMPVPG